jgi:GAF domain
VPRPRGRTDQALSNAIGMDHYSILDAGSSSAPKAPPLGKSLVPQDTNTNTDHSAKQGADPAPARLQPNSSSGVVARQNSSLPKLRFPGEDGGRSLAEMAQRDLEATLQLLAERAQYITAATGAAVALRLGDEMVCRGSSGASAPALGAHLQVDSGLTGESVRTRQILHCDDAENDPRVNRESCEALGIASLVVMPLRREEEVNGLFELFSDTSHAFTERDLAALERMGEMVQIALEHAEAAGVGNGFASSREHSPPPTAPGAEKPVATPGSVAPTLKKSFPPAEFQVPNGETHAPTFKREPVDDLFLKEARTLSAPQTKAPSSASEGQAPTTLLGDPKTIRKCESCGFPISEGRKLCLDCEAKIPKADAPASKTPVTAEASPEFIPQFMGGGADILGTEKSWLFKNKYVVAALVMVVMVVIAFLLSRS